jgi:hypothetical protein
MGARMFRTLYESTWLHPVLFWVAGVALVLSVARRLPFLPGFLVAFGVEILADATLTSAWSPIPQGSGWATVAAILFVVLGDARYFVLVERARDGRVGATQLARALGFAVIVPIASFVPQAVAPQLFTNARVTFLTYEAMFLALALAFRVWLPGRLATASAPDRTWALRLTELEIAQYGTWVLADVLILAGHDVGFAVRIVPNTLYYVLFLPFVAWTAPRPLREPWHAAAT